MHLYEDSVRPTGHVAKFEYMPVAARVSAYNEAVKHCIRYGWLLPQPQSFALSTFGIRFLHDCEGHGDVTGYIEAMYT